MFYRVESTQHTVEKHNVHNLYLAVQTVITYSDDRI